jgi:hypothetical protein
MSCHAQRTGGMIAQVAPCLVSVAQSLLPLRVRVHAGTPGHTWMGGPAAPSRVRAAVCTDPAGLEPEQPLLLG